MYAYAHSRKRFGSERLGHQGICIGGAMSSDVSRSICFYTHITEKLGVYPICCVAFKKFFKIF